jgi:uracil-DNA glycosylase family 4
LDESGVYITHVVYWRPPGNRTPTLEEVEACAPFLARQIELVAPKVLVLLGGAAAKSMLGTSEGIMRLRGKWLNYGARSGTISTLANLDGKNIALAATLSDVDEGQTYRAWRDTAARLVTRPSSFLSRPIAASLR